MKRCLIALAGLAFCLFGADGLQAQAEYEEGAFYVRLKPASAPRLAKGETQVRLESLPFLQQVSAPYGIHPDLQSMRVGMNERLGRTFRIEFDSLSKTGDLAAWLASHPEVEMVERVPMYYIQGSVASHTENPGLAVADKENPAGDAKPEDSGSDPFYGTVNGANLSWHLDLIHAEAAWEKATGSPSVKVAVVDNAVWGSHPDLGLLEENQYNVMSEIQGNSAPPTNVDQEQECSSLSSCNVYNWSHGTHCAGAIGAVRGNGVGIASIGSGVTLMGVSCPSTDASGLSVRNGFAGVTWAAEHGADVISLSWGGYSVAETEREVIQSCIDQGIVVVAAAGNDGQSSPFYPANLPGVISVASVNSDLGISSFSNYGEWVCVAAPGGFIVTNGNETANCILSTTFCRSQSYRMSGITAVNGEFYDGMYGTSMATPVVAGLCGLLRSIDSSLDSYAMREVLMASAQDLNISDAREIRPSSGVIDAAAAVDLVQSGLIKPRDLEARREGALVFLEWNEPGINTPVEPYQVFRNDVFIGETSSANLYSFVDTVTEEGLWHYTVRGLYNDREDTTFSAAVDVRVPRLYEVAVSISPEGCGTVLGAGYHESEEEIVLTARAVRGCEFVRWTEDGRSLGRDTVLSYTVEYDTEIGAVFSGEPDHTASESLQGSIPVSVWPNPFRNTLNLESPVAIRNLELYSLDGKKLKEIETGGTNSFELDMSSLPAGTYLLRIGTASGTESRRITKM